MGVLYHKDILMILKFLIIADLILSLASIQYENENKLDLEPIDVIEFILEEHVKNSSDKDLDSSNLDNSNFNSSSEMNEEVTFTEDVDDNAEAMKKRKVWSRWSKWGKCTVSCGEGSITRLRVCVAGKCAPGEKEEQKRPCKRAPCKFHTVTTDELLETE